MASQGYEEDLLRRWFPGTEQQTEPSSFTEKDIRDISSILERANKEAWSRIPRIYIVLRLINQLGAIDGFVRQDISDTWFPFTQRRLPDCLRGQSDRADFLETQKLVCNTKALNLERAGAGHGHFPDPSEIPLKKIGELGKGGSGFVERVISTVTHREYALKLIKRGETFRKDRKVLKDFENELSNLKKLSLGHKHIIDLIGSYTEPRYVGILFPVADCNLAVLLERAGIDDRRWSLRSYFGCLTSALGFLHDNKIRHKDIKPQNILIKDDEPYFTDFGVSVDWTEYGQSTTIGPTALTPRYAAPEVAASEPRNSSSDIWSLGCVFLEIWTALKGASIKELTEHWTIDGRLMPYYSGDVDTTVWMDRMYALDAPLSDNLPLEWIKPMLERDGKERFSAHLVVEKIRDYAGDPSAQYLYIGRCCLDDEDTAESVTSHAEDRVGDVTIKPASASLGTIRSSNKKPTVPPADTSTVGDMTDSLPKPVAREDKWLATDSATLVPSEDDDETRTQGTRRKKKSMSKEGVQDVVVQYTVHGDGDTYFPAQLASAKTLYKLGYAYERNLWPNGFIVYQPLSEAEVHEVVKRTIIDDPVKGFEHNLTPIYNYHVIEDSRLVERFHTSDKRLFRNAWLREGVICWPEANQTEFKKNLVFRDTIRDLGYLYKETRDYFYILELLNTAQAEALIVNSANGRRRYARLHKRKGRDLGPETKSRTSSAEGTTTNARHPSRPEEARRRHPSERPLSDHPKDLGMSNDDSQYTPRYGPVDVRQAAPEPSLSMRPRKTVTSNRERTYKPEDVSYARTYGPEDLQWAPRSRENDRLNQQLPKSVYYHTNRNPERTGSSDSSGAEKRFRARKERAALYEGESRRWAPEEAAEVSEEEKRNLARANVFTAWQKMKNPPHDENAQARADVFTAWQKMKRAPIEASDAYTPSVQNTQQQASHSPSSRDRTSIQAAPVLVHQKRSRQEGKRPASSRHANHSLKQSDRRYDTSASVENYGQDSDGYDSADSALLDTIRRPATVPTSILVSHRSVKKPSVPHASSLRTDAPSRETINYELAVPKRHYSAYTHPQQPSASKVKQPTDVEYPRGFKFAGSGFQFTDADDVFKEFMGSGQPEIPKPTGDEKHDTTYKGFQFASADDVFSEFLRSDSGRSLEPTRNHRRGTTNQGKQDTTTTRLNHRASEDSFSDNTDRSIVDYDRNVSTRKSDKASNKTQQATVEDDFTDESEDNEFGGARSTSEEKKGPQQNPSYSQEDVRWVSRGEEGRKPGGFKPRNATYVY